MLLLHGFPEFWYSWRHQIREFQQDFRVVALDQRGYGQSDRPEGVENYVMSRLMNDVRRVIEKLGYSSCVLVGHDFGGLVAWAFGRKYPTYVDKLVVMNAPPRPVFTKALEEIKEQKAMSWYIFFLQIQFMQLPERFCRHCDYSFIDRMFGNLDTPCAVNIVSKKLEAAATQADIEAYKYVFSEFGISPPIHWYRALFTERLSYDMGYTMPVLLLWGMKDLALHHRIPDMVEEEEQRWNTSNISVRRIPDAGHMVQMDRPEEVNRHVREWLGALPS